jgi:hypothetical protein
LGAQLLAGVATNGVNLGKRDLTEAELRGFWSDFWNNAIKPPLENALSGKYKWFGKFRILLKNHFRSFTLGCPSFSWCC